MGCLEPPRAVIEHIECQDGESKSVAELLDEKAKADSEYIGCQGIAQVDIDDIGERDGAHHGPQPALHAITGDKYAADNTSQQKADEPHRAIGKAELLWRQPQSPTRVWPHEERLGHRIKQGLRESVKQQEKHYSHSLFQGELREELREHLYQSVGYLLECPLCLLVTCGTRQPHSMVKP